MKFSTVFFTSLLAVAPALAAPQEASGTTTQAPSTSVSLTPVQTCLAACPASDVTCQARCVGVARPNEAQANQTTECAAACDQGDGSPEATQKYAKCQQDCFASYFPAAQTTGPFAAGAASTNAAQTTGSGSGSSSGSGSGSSTSSGSGPSSTGANGSSTTPNAAPVSGAVGAFVGIAGFAMAFAAL